MHTHTRLCGLGLGPPVACGVQAYRPAAQPDAPGGVRLTPHRRQRTRLQGRRIRGPQRPSSRTSSPNAMLYPPIVWNSSQLWQQITHPPRARAPWPIAQIRAEDHGVRYLKCEPPSPSVRHHTHMHPCAMCSSNPPHLHQASTLVKNSPMCAARYSGPYTSPHRRRCTRLQDRHIRWPWRPSSRMISGRTQPVPGTPWPMALTCPYSCQ
ncbi:hypothetical protein JB92DRAFT_386485 [Gautieria morchelliformis]|nr:hypothetical protein JB92DRAFT_386485 [Gautieria morchelliformis]